MDEQLTREQMLQKYAEDHSVPLEYLYVIGVDAYPCRCGEEGCRGWVVLSTYGANVMRKTGLIGSSVKNQN